MSNAGAAYLYRLESNGTVTYLTKVTAPDKAATDYFGKRVSQSGDILAVGAYKSDPDGIIDAGAAYLYRLESNGTATYQLGLLLPINRQLIYLVSRISIRGYFSSWCICFRSRRSKGCGCRLFVPLGKQ